jgi:hypothetical protein
MLGCLLVRFDQVVGHIVNAKHGSDGLMFFAWQMEDFRLKSLLQQTASTQRCGEAGMEAVLIHVHRAKGKSPGILGNPGPRKFVALRSRSASLIKSTPRLVFARSNFVNV